ncbi:TPA: hypothetical protein PTW06_000981 [Clostridium botulinum]|nr:hypothetical protein [Clostridium botulinum]HDK7223538.1 hypothetical protein [Clostridium botulinum]HDK7271130.1 hypothetical protein [Clostridium botulinum]HDK7304486.1 hypothetical protein [Clostridium botulinum]
MTTLSKSHEKCEKCKDKDNCDNKRMVACRFDEIPRPKIEKMTIPNAQPLCQPIYAPITINMGGYEAIDTTLEEINKERLL